MPKSIAFFDALWARVSSWLFAGQTLLLLRTVWRGLWQNLQNQTSLRRSVSCDICSCDAEYIAATASTSEAKYIQALFLACGQHVNIHLRSDSSGAIVASRRGLQRLRHLDVRFLWLQAETASKNIQISKVPGPENVESARNCGAFKFET